MNCRPGDIAYIKHDVYPENIGRFVQVVGAPSAWLLTGAEPGLNWHVRSEMPMVCGRYDPSTRAITGRFELHDACVLDVNLRPIRPGDISDEEVRDLYAPKTPEHA